MVEDAGNGQRHLAVPARYPPSSATPFASSLPFIPARVPLTHVGGLRIAKLGVTESG